jgi:hypothetical protein
MKTATSTKVGFRLCSLPLLLFLIALLILSVDLLIGFSLRMLELSALYQHALFPIGFPHIGFKVCFGF